MVGVGGEAVGLDGGSAVHAAAFAFRAADLAALRACTDGARWGDFWSLANERLSGPALKFTHD